MTDSGWNLGEDVWGFVCLFVPNSISGGGLQQGSRNLSALSAALKAIFHSHSHFKLSGEASQLSSHFKLAGKAKFPSKHFKMVGTVSQLARQPASKVASQVASEQASF